LDEFGLCFLVCAEMAMKQLLKFVGVERLGAVRSGFEAKAIGVVWRVRLEVGMGHGSHGSGKN
jgi:hypothetical protein